MKSFLVEVEGDSGESPLFLSVEFDSLQRKVLLERSKRILDFINAEPQIEMECVYPYQEPGLALHDERDIEDFLHDGAMTELNEFHRINLEDFFLPKKLPKGRKLCQPRIHFSPNGIWFSFYRQGSDEMIRTETATAIVYEDIFSPEEIAG